MALQFVGGNKKGSNTSAGKASNHNLALQECAKLCFASILIQVLISIVFKLKCKTDDKNRGFRI